MDEEAPDRDVPSLGALVRRLRLRRGVTQEELAERARVSARAISDLERGIHRRAHPETVGRLADALGLDPVERAGLDRLLHLSPARRPSNPTGSAAPPERDEPWRLRLIAPASSLSSQSPRPPLASETFERGAGPTTPAPRHNLPARLTSFVGRERELVEVRRLRGATRLLTLTGTGGSGKTRLALRVAAEGFGEYPDGVWFVELDALADPSLVAQTVATVLRVAEVPGQPILTTLVSALRERHFLLVLDNCEHLVTACAELSDHLLRACPRLQILATSREVLRIDGETTYLVPPLSLPDPSQSPHVEDLVRSEAVCLFLDRAANVQPDFALTSENAAAVAHICWQLDGLPLAIELAAAYVRGLSVARLADRLDRRLDLLSRGSRVANPRHQTLRALLDWSYNLLDEPERALFARLAAFAGGFTLPAAEAVGAGAGLPASEVLPSLVRLVDASLVVAGASGERYHLLETLRQYAAECLEASGLADLVRRRHADYYLDLAEGAAARYGGPEHDAWERQFAVERDNLRGALAWLRDHDPACGLRLASLHERFWYVHGHTSEGRAWLESLLGRVPDHSAARAAALRDLAGLHELQRDMDLAQGRAEESLAIARELDDRQAMLHAARFLGALAQGADNFERAHALLEESAILAQEAGDPNEVIRAQLNLGLLAMNERDLPWARQLLEEALARSRDAGYRFGAVATLGRLGSLARLEGDYPRARALLDEGIALARAIGHRPAAGTYLASRGNLARCEGDFAAARVDLEEALREVRLPFLVVTCLGSFGILAIDSGAPAAGVRLIAAATRQDSTLNGMHFPELRIDWEESLPRARAALGEPAFAAAWEAGRKMTVEQAMTAALTSDG